MIESLHSHTTLSDGLLSHEEVLALAGRLGYGVVAFTDHDALPNEETVAMLQAYQGKPDWIIGIEMTVGPPPESPVDGHGSLHVVGLFVDPANAPLREHCKKVQEARVARAEAIARNLQTRGHIITYDEVAALSGGDSVGAPHIVAALVARPENVLRLQEELAALAPTDPDTKRYVEKVKTRNPRDQAFALYLADKALISGVRAKISYRLPLDQSVALIRGAGGVSSLAHYFAMGARAQIPEPLLAKLLLEKRLDALEVINSDRHISLSENKARHNHLTGLAQKTGALTTGGADAHSREDFASFARDPEAQRTAGMTAALIKIGKVSTTHSSFTSL